jgi:serine/threonine-protein kinase
MSEPTSELPQNLPIDADLEVGHHVGEYVVDGKLGQGAFGSVFRAAHPVIGKVVAIKVLARRFSVDPEMVSRFIAEARAVNQIRHRHIIDIFAFGQLEDGRHYYVMEYLDGEPLDALIERQGKLPLPDAMPILRGIARALDAAHAKGIAHRDLKAENVFLAADPDGGGSGVWPKLLDFGIAKLLAPDDGLKHKTRTGTPVGTPFYMSPEQCRGRDVDHRTDLYAFGVLAYLLLTGRYPFDADDYMSILIQQMSDQAPPPSSIEPSLPGGIDDAIGWLMAKNPDERPPNLRAAIAAFETAAEQAGIAIGSPTGGWDVALRTGPVASLDTRPPNTASARSGLSSKPPVAGAEAVPDDEGAPRSRTAIVAIVVTLSLIAGVGAFVLAYRPGDDGAPPAPPAPPAPLAQPTPPVPSPAPPDAPAIAELDAAPAPAAMVIIDVAGVPDGTEVIVAGATVGAAPGPVQLPRSETAVVLTFKLDGHLPASRTVTPDRDQPLKLSLKRKPRAGAGARPPGKDDIIDVDFDREPKK